MPELHATFKKMSGLIRDYLNAAPEEMVDMRVYKGIKAPGDSWLLYLKQIGNITFTSFRHTPAK